MENVIEIILFLGVIFLVWKNLMYPYFKIKKLIKTKDWNKLAKLLEKDTNSSQNLSKFEITNCKSVNLENNAQEIFPVLPLTQKVFLDKSQKQIREWQNWFEALFDLSDNEILEQEASLIKKIPTNIKCNLPPVVYILKHADFQTLASYGVIEQTQNKFIVTISGTFIDKNTKDKTPIYFSVIYDKKSKSVYLANPLTIK